MKGNNLDVYNNVNGFQKLCAKNPDVRRKETAENDSDAIIGIAFRAETHWR